MAGLCVGGGRFFHLHSTACSAPQGIAAEEPSPNPFRPKHSLAGKIRRKCSDSDDRRLSSCVGARNARPTRTAPMQWQESQERQGARLPKSTAWSSLPAALRA